MAIATIHECRGHRGTRQLTSSDSWSSHPLGGFFCFRPKRENTLSDIDTTGELEKKLADAEARIAELTKELTEANESTEKWKGHAKTWEDRSKENFEKAKRLDEIEEQSKTDLEKAQARAEAAEKAVADRDAADKQREEERAAKEALDKDREAIWEAKGLKDRGLSASILRGNSREDLEAHAAELIEAIPLGSASGSGGAGDDITEGELTADDIVAQVSSR